mgnify:CR=1 FL=1
MRGHVTVSLGNESRFDGELGINTLDLVTVFGLAVDFGGRDPAEPLNVGLPEGWRGQLAFAALRGTLPGGAELRPVSGVVKGYDHSLTFDAMKGKIGDGDATACPESRGGGKPRESSEHCRYRGRLASPLCGKSGRS